MLETSCNAGFKATKQLLNVASFKHQFLGHKLTSNYN
ncbi:hypothetical protein T10_2393 [Trichinella papuae]|uniref:Uncharacterized protein n=1 Tax=Trichinella papuae TaxID=268474 RepID=A0A0V1LXB5_9BILA|nr:hypothetical protein T10_2393 [Trichinella papuae]